MSYTSADERTADIAAHYEIYSGTADQILALRAAARESAGTGLDERLEGAKELFRELIGGDSDGFIPAEAGIKDKDGKSEDWLPVGFVFAAFEKVKARLAAQKETPDD